MIYCELNRTGFLKAKKDFGFRVEKSEGSFLNFVPFAERNKDKQPLMEVYNKN